MRNKTNKTAAKRLRATNPRGNRKAKVLYNKSCNSHLKTKRSRRSKRRVLPRHTVDTTVLKGLKKAIGVKLK